MSVTEFAMVEELAFLLKDNLRCKHLVLSMEETFINFLHDDTSSSHGVLELEPMDPYNRLLLHRLADIFGFAHVSVGEGDNRHLILERCSETSIPSILVSDILSQYDEPHSPTTLRQLLIKDALPVLPAKSPPRAFEERESAYLAARECIFSRDVKERRETVKEKPRNAPLVARRMIAHALGSPWNQGAAVRDGAGHAVKTSKQVVQDKDKIETNSDSEALQGTVFLAGKNINSPGKTKSSNQGSSASSPGQRSSSQVLLGNGCADIISKPQNQMSANGIKDYSKEELVGAAKRMFAHELDRQLGDFQTRSSEREQDDE